LGMDVKVNKIRMFHGYLILTNINDFFA
jgi:hypothetical protein